MRNHLHNPSPNTSPLPDDEPQTIVFHVSRHDVVELDLQFVVAMLHATLQAPGTARSLAGRVRFQYEAEVASLALHGCPGPHLRAHLRLFHLVVPLWPYLCAGDDPWCQWVTLANLRSAGCSLDARTQRLTCWYDPDALEEYLASTHQGMLDAAAEIGLPASAWKPAMNRLAKRLRRLASPSKI